MKIFIVTSSRADYGLLKPLISKLVLDNFFDVKIVATGAHLSERFGYTIDEIYKDGFHVHFNIPIIKDETSPQGLTEICSTAIAEFGKLYSRELPDAVFVLGDRYEILCSVFAALFFKIPVIHYSGGEKTEGAFDDAIRHSITKMSHLHFVSSNEYRDRVIQLGENPSSVFNVGSLGVDNIVNTKLLSKEELEDSIAVKLDHPYFLVSYHPETLSVVSAELQFEAVLSALDLFKDYQIIFTKSNADEGGDVISRMMDEYVNSHDNAVVFDSLGLLRYLSTIRYSSLVIGNSSSGITEVPSFNKPTINIGSRQQGRLQSSSIINCEIDSVEIINAIRTGISKEFQDSLKNHISPFGNGTASQQIVDIVKSHNFRNIVKKSFFDLKFPNG